MQASLLQHNPLFQPPLLTAVEGYHRLGWAIEGTAVRAEAQPIHGINRPNMASVSGPIYRLRAHLDPLVAARCSLPPEAQRTLATLEDGAAGSVRLAVAKDEPSVTVDFVIPGPAGAALTAGGDGDRVTVLAEAPGRTRVALREGWTTFFVAGVAHHGDGTLTLEFSLEEGQE